MATKGTAAKSASGAAMSKYDVEVEARLKALEQKAHTPCNGGGGDSDRISALEAKYTFLLEELKAARLNLDFNDLSL
tara:strand:- start:235 stop:465 length:231 start_codon:yes stop_codon:yes gene_type:complete